MVQGTPFGEEAGTTFPIDGKHGAEATVRRGNEMAAWR
jgi:hypothetical protein